MKVKLTQTEADYVRGLWERYDGMGHPEWKERDKEDNDGMASFLFPVFAAQGMTLGDAEARAASIKKNGWEF